MRSALSLAFPGQNLGSIQGSVNLGVNDVVWTPDGAGSYVSSGAPDGRYVRFTGDGTFGGGTGNGSFTMAFDFFAQGTPISPTGFPLIVYTGHASEGVRVVITQTELFSSSLTNNQASYSQADTLSFITSPSVTYVPNRLTTDGQYSYSDGVMYFSPSEYTVLPNFAWNDVVGVRFTFAVTGYTSGQFFELDTVSNTYDPVPIPPPPATPVPEPATMLLLASGLVGRAGVRRLRKD
jgi:hypothetical protein